MEEKIGNNENTEQKSANDSENSAVTEQKSANDSENSTVTEQKSANDSENSTKTEQKTQKKPNKLISFYRDFKSKHSKFCEIVRFLVVGCINTLIDMFTMGVVLYIFDPSLYPNFFNVFYGGGSPSTIATVVGTGTGFVVSLIVSYFLSIIFVFEDKGNSKSAKGAVLFAVLATIGLAINTVGMWIGYDLLHINEWIVKIIMTLVVLVWNYLTRKLFIFKREKKPEKTA